jgi:hypothetical protein
MLRGVPVRGLCFRVVSLLTAYSAGFSSWRGWVLSVPCPDLLPLASRKCSSGTTVTAADWAQNFNRQSRDIYKDGDETTTNPCQVRAGFAEFVDTTRFPLAVEDVTACVADLCNDGTDTNCLVVTGHSQGGATATVASILMYSLNPTVITFGQPITADTGCAYIPSQRMYRYVNFVATESNKTTTTSGGSNSVTMMVDVVTIAPAAFSGSVHYGHFIAIGPDPQAVRYYGIDNNVTFGGTLSLGGLMPHDINIEAGNHSYEARMTALLASAQQSSPINALGFSPGTLCAPGPLGDLCSKRCDRVTHRCADALVQDLCVVDSCEASYECESGVCSGASACSAGASLTTGGCPCSTDDDCASGSCGFLAKTCQYSDGEATKSPATATLRPAASPATTPSGPSNDPVSSAAAGAGRSLDVLIVGLSIVWGALGLLL